MVAGGANLCLPHQTPGEVVIIGNDPLCAAIGDGAGLQAGDPGQVAFTYVPSVGCGGWWPLRPTREVTCY